MKKSINAFVKVCSETLRIQEPIYEFGSRQITGQEAFSDLRSHFYGRDYKGTDIYWGPGVDVILDIHKIDLPDNSVGTAICCETIEHIEYPRKAVQELYRVLKHGGVLILTSAMLIPIHNYPHDYWRYTPEGFESLLRPFDSRYVDWNGKKDNPHTVVGVGVKGPYSFERLYAARDQWRSVSDRIPGYLLFKVYDRIVHHNI